MSWRTPRVHALFGFGTFCGHLPRTLSVRFDQLPAQPNACQRCLRKVRAYQRSLGHHDDQVPFPGATRTEAHRHA